MSQGGSVSSAAATRGLPRVGLIGCGDWGRNHARVLHRFGTLVAAADAVATRAEDLAGRFDCLACSVPQMLADPEIDAVVIAVAPAAQAALASRAAAAGKHLLVEKPMALDPAEARRLCATAAASGVVAMTGHILRFHPAFVALSEIVRAGGLGRLRRIEARRKGQGKLFAQVDVLWDLAPHDLAMLLCLTGRRPDVLRGRRARVCSELADIAEIDLDFDDGPVARLELSRVHPVRERRLEVAGTQGTAVFDDLAPWPRKLTLARPGAAPQPVPLPQTMPLDAQTAHFFGCIRDGTAPLASVQHGLQVLELLHAIPMVEVAADRLVRDPAGAVPAMPACRGPS